MVHIRLVPHVSHGKPCHVFDVIERDMLQGTVLQLGRCATTSTTMGEQRSCLIFRSKVVSRHHAELWSDGNKLFIRDIGSSSGTFVNHLRLSPPRKQSKSHQVVHDGDVIQLGIDYQKGIEPAFRAVRMRVEIMPCSSDKHVTTKTFSKSVFERLHVATSSVEQSQDQEECCICLCPIASSQALFVAPCAHIYHYKCMRPVMEQHFPAFSCPICRAYCDLDENVDDACVMTPTTTTSNGYKPNRHMLYSKQHHRNARHFKTLSPHAHAAFSKVMLPTHSNMDQQEAPPPSSTHIQMHPFHAIVA